MKAPTRRKPTVPPPIPDSKKDVQDKALAALSSIVNTPTPPGDVNQTGLGELPNATVPPTPSPAIPYPVNQPNSNPYSQQGGNNMRPPQANMRQASPPRPMQQGSGGLPMPMAPGQLPISPGTPPVTGPYASPQNGYMPQGSGQMMQRPMLAGARPDMMRPAPGYGPGHAPPRQNGKLLIGFISVTLVLVVVGLVATIMGQMDDETAEGGAVGPDGGAEVALATGDGGVPAEATEDSGAAGSVATGDPKKNADAAVEVAEGDKSADAGATVASTTQLPVATWGTDESFLKGIPDIKPTVEPIEPVAPPDPPPVVEDPPKDPDPPKVEDKPKSNRPKNNRPKNNRPKNNRPKNNRPRNNGDDDDDDDDPPRMASGDASAAKAAAKNMYKRKDFEEAADRLSDAADSADEKTSDRLLDIAAGYRQVGSLLSSAQREQESNPTGALKDYKKALKLDKKFGSNAHTRLIRLRIGQVAPRAAKSYMAKKKFADALKAANDAKRYDQEDAVQAVYNSLERKANSLIKKAMKAKRKDPDEAKRLLRDATKIAPKDTDAYDDARSELKDF
jgi:outer membrane biosynthesis protein TonB